MAATLGDSARLVEQNGFGVSDHVLFQAEHIIEP